MSETHQTNHLRCITLVQWQQTKQFLDSCDPQRLRQSRHDASSFTAQEQGWGQGVRRAKDVTCDEWEDGLSARFLKSATIIRRDVTPVKESFEVPICIVEANKGIFATSSLTRELYAKQGRKPGGGGGRHTALHSLRLCEFTWRYFF